MRAVLALPSTLVAVATAAAGAQDTDSSRTAVHLWGGYAGGFGSARGGCGGQPCLTGDAFAFTLAAGVQLARPPVRTLGAPALQLGWERSVYQPLGGRALRVDRAIVRASVSRIVPVEPGFGIGRFAYGPIRGRAYGASVRARLLPPAWQSPYRRFLVELYGFYAREWMAGPRAVAPSREFEAGFPDGFRPRMASFGLGGGIRWRVR